MDFHYIFVIATKSGSERERGGTMRGQQVRVKGGWIGRSCSGFSLIELMVVVGVLVFLGILASSNLMDTSGWMAHYRLKSAAKQLMQAMQTARMEAIERNQCCTVVFDQSADDGTHYDCLVFVDANDNLEYDDNNNGTYDPPGDEVIVKKFRLSDYRGVTFDGGLNGSNSAVTFANNDDGKPAVAFTPRGLCKSNGGNFSGGQVKLKNDHGETVKLVVNSIGYINIQR